MGRAIQAQCKTMPDIKVHDFQAEETEFCDETVVIDFSSPQGFVNALQFCIKNKIPLISGTTGLVDKHLRQVDDAKKIIPILIAPNMSLGIANLKSSIEEYLSSTNTTVKCKVVEIHHTNKKDSPSGTALEIVRLLENHYGNKIDGSIEINSYRVGNIFGIHRIEFKSEAGIINFQHIAGSRKVFATGALNAAKSINSMKIGEYSFTDFLNKKL